MKFQSYKGGPITGTLTLKIDGVRAHCKDGVCVTRNGKPLYNLPLVEDGIYEIYKANWETSVSMCRTHNGDLIQLDCLYRLDTIDPRLVIRELVDEVPPPIQKGTEGYVVHPQLIKIKSKESYDVEVIGVQPGTGKHSGRMGALITCMGKVGTGFTDSDREKDFLGQIIEVECMSLTPAGMFRHPVFKRIRFDK